MNAGIAVMAPTTSAGRMNPLDESWDRCHDATTSAGRVSP